MAGIEDGDAVVDAAFPYQSVQLPHDRGLVGIGQRTHLIPELLSVKARDVLNVFQRRVELRYAA